MKRILFTLIITLCLCAVSFGATPQAVTDTIHVTNNGTSTYLDAFTSSWSITMASGTIDTLTLPAGAANIQIINNGTSGDTVFLSLNQVLTDGSSTVGHFPIKVINGATQLLQFKSPYIKRLIVKSSSTFAAIFEAY